MEKILLTHKKWRIFLFCLSVICTASCMVTIFYFSSQSGEASKALSNGFLTWLLDKLPFAITHAFLRKIAHFSEFALLGALLSLTFFFGFGTKKHILPFCVGVLYAISDEIHQIWVPGRACRVFDVFIDTLGVLTGILVIVLFLFIVNHFIKQYRRNRNYDVPKLYQI